MEKDLTILNGRIRFHLQETLYIIIYWVLASMLFIFFKFGDLNPDHYRITYETRQMPSIDRLYWIAGISGLTFGTVSAILYTFSFQSLFIRWRFILALFTRISIFTCLLYLIVYVVRLKLSQTDEEVRVIFQARSMLSFLTYTLIAQVMLDFLLLARRSLGPGYLTELVFNRHYTPREKCCTFLFLDLASSTAIAEEIGHLSFSALLQDCFNDLSDVALDKGAAIYQFVGDEAVLVWNVDAKFRRERAIELNDAFQKRIHKRTAHYQKNYGRVPLFRGAIHEGNVVIATVGKFKPEKAYHGDVLNTTARVLALCKQFDAQLMITEKVYLTLDDPYSERFESVPATPLLGKKDEVQLYKLMQNYTSVTIEANLEVKHVATE